MFANLEKHNRKGQFDFALAETFVVEADYTLRTEPSEVVNLLKKLVK